MKFTSLIILMTLSSCALVDGYEDNQHSWYKKALSENEKTQIIEDGFIYKDWDVINRDGDFNRGKLYIEKLSDNKKHFNFVEIGSWEEKFHLSSSREEIKRKTHYDDYGNILERKAWMKKNSDNDFYLLENWTSEYKSVNADSVLVQKIQTFYDNGMPSQDFQLAIIDFETKRSDRLKTKYQIDTAYQFDIDGKLLDKKIHKLSDSLK